MTRLNFMHYLRLTFLSITISLIAVTASWSCETVIVLAQADIITLDEAVKKVKKNNNGKVLSAQTKQIDGQSMHIIKILTVDGHVKKVRIKHGADHP